jgi:hypothetical protein
VARTNGNVHSKSVYLQMECLIASPFSSFIGLLRKEIVVGGKKKGSTPMVLTCSRIQRLMLMKTLCFTR